MLKILPKSPSNGPAAAKKLTIELVGPAGSGKTTLRKLLCNGQQPLVDPSIPTSVEALQQLVDLTLPLLPMYVRPGIADRSPTWEEVRSMLYLQAWLRPGSSRRSDRLFDQGPVFRLAMLQEFGPRTTRNTAFDRWISQGQSAWSQALDLVIVLDAPNSELMRRIREREKPHRCKSLGDAEAYPLLNRYRDAHENVLNAMQRLGGPRIVRFASDAQNPEQIARAVHDELRAIRQPVRHPAQAAAVQVVS